MLDKVKLQITADYLPSYSKSVLNCPDFNVLGKITRNLVQNLIAEVFPGEQLALLPYRDPQASQNSD